jgi:putative redox protein
MVMFGCPSNQEARTFKRLHSRRSFREESDMVTAESRNNYQVEIWAGQHRWISDEPVSSGGDDAGPAPYELLLGALAACKVMTVRMYAERKHWPLKRIRTKLERHKVDAGALGEGSFESGATLDLIDVDIEFEGDLSEQQRTRLLEISERCPVHRTLTGDIQIRSKMALPVP